MISKKTQDILSTIDNIYKTVSKSISGGYTGSVQELIREAMKQTAKDDGKGYSTVASSMSRGINIIGEGSMDKVYEMIESACTGKEFNHYCDDLLIYLKDSINGNDDSADEVEREYIKIFQSENE